RELVGAAQPAGRGAADLDVVAPDRLQVEHAVEGADLVDPDRRHIEDLGDMVHRGARQPAAVLALRQVEQRQHGARLPPGGIAGDDAVVPGAVLRGEGEALGLAEVGRDAAHRSISPKTMSMDPRIATESASMWPRVT